MGNKPIDGQTLKKLVEAGLRWLRTHQEVVNALNVFPVPDGDTGTNMVLTMQAAYDEIADFPERHFGRMAHAVAQGALMGARGNSGVILSQIWRGFARGTEQVEQLDAATFVQAMAQARDTAYKGVVRPVEGTILTVIKEVAAAVAEAAQETDEVTALLQRAVEAADAAVAQTPELLPILKEAGVVDSGGKGLFFILEGMWRWIQEMPLDQPVVQAQPLASLEFAEAHEQIEPGQDFEVVVDFRPQEPLDLQSFYGELEKMGTSIQVGEGDGMYRMHIHVPTEKLYDPIEYVRTLGTVTKVQIENLLAQMEDMEAESVSRASYEVQNIKPGQIAVVAVAPGPGIARVFASLGAAAIVEGGQTMNPSTQDLLRAFENLPTERVILLPNNKNVILAAQAAAEVTVKQTRIVPSRTVPQGLAAMLSYDPDGDLDEVAAAMEAAMADVVTGEITRATRTVEIDGVRVREGQYIGLVDGKLLLGGDSLEEVLLDLLAQADIEERELVTMFYGGELTKAQANRLGDAVRERFPHLEVELQEGGQPHYALILSLE
ncbi:MAG TPA: DAK2 domain-containing protein [Anaerolineaceae bacterium]|nr:DAK2 domain-containing protein [Anaerolineales bacterium]HIQ09393.1 DAK2 domain-containing protein [Anaerolineaceae bacterium]